jgi:hypothetical protein
MFLDSIIDRIDRIYKMKPKCGTEVGLVILFTL